MITVLFPISAQFNHSLIKHHYIAVNKQHQSIDVIKSNCIIYHYQLNYNTYNFSSDFSFLLKKPASEKVIVVKTQKKQAFFRFKSSRDPPLI